MQNKKAPLVKIYTYIIIVAGFVILAYLTVTSPPSGNWWPAGERLFDGLARR